MRTPQIILGFSLFHFFAFVSHAEEISNNTLHDACAATRKIQQYIIEKTESGDQRFLELGNQIAYFEKDVCAYANAEHVTRATMSDLNRKADILTKKIIEAESTAPPEYKNAVFSCLSDHGLCVKYYGVTESSMDQALACGFAFLLCFVQNLIPFTK